MSASSSQVSVEQFNELRHSVAELLHEMELASEYLFIIFSLSISGVVPVRCQTKLSHARRPKDTTREQYSSKGTRWRGKRAGADGCATNET